MDCVNGPGLFYMGRKCEGRTRKIKINEGGMKNPEGVVTEGMRDTRLRCVHE